MRQLKLIVLGAIALAIAGCAVLEGKGPFPGSALSPARNLLPGKSVVKDVEGQMGQPAEKITLANGETEWFYPRNQAGRQTIAVQFSPDGVVRSIEERLEPGVIRKVVPEVTTMRQVRELLGPPNRVTRASLFREREGWEYFIYDASQQKDILYLQFSPDGVLRDKYITRDPTAVGGEP